MSHHGVGFCEDLDHAVERADSGWPEPPPGHMKTLCDILVRIRRAAREDLLCVRSPDTGELVSVSAAQFLARVDRCAAALARVGVGRGDRVGLICRNRPEWHIIDFGCQRLGAVLVPLFPTLTGRQATYCFGDSGSKVVIVEGGDQLDKLVSVSGALPELAVLAVIDPPECLPVGPAGMRIFGFDELLAQGDGTPAELAGPESPDAVATIIYTSGTTGSPKGVMLTHRNLISNTEALQRFDPLSPADIGLSVLPLCHVYQRTADYVCLAAGARLAYSGPEKLSIDFKVVRPTVMVGVPRLYQKLRAAIEAQVARGGAFDRRVYGLALRVGMKRARSRHGGTSEGLLNKLLHPVLEFVVLRKIRAAAGGRIRAFAAGGAALDASLNWWYAAIGWELAQGYGLTESSPVISTNRIADNRIGSVGQPLPGVEVRIEVDGEILVRGPNVMKGYWHRRQETEETIVDGWLRTGDIGKLDADGFLWITDRKKAILVTSTGKNVAPAPLENALQQSPYIQQVIVLGDGRRFIAALIVPSFDQLERWAGERGLGTDHADLCKASEVMALMQSEIDGSQAELARYQKVRAFRLLERPFTEEQGHLTPTMKLIRRAVLAQYADLIEEIYAE